MSSVSLCLPAGSPRSAAFCPSSSFPRVWLCSTWDYAVTANLSQDEEFLLTALKQLLKKHALLKKHDLYNILGLHNMVYYTVF